MPRTPQSSAPNLAGAADLEACRRLRPPGPPASSRRLCAMISALDGVVGGCRQTRAAYARSSSTRTRPPSTSRTAGMHNNFRSACGGKKASAASRELRSKARAGPAGACRGARFKHPNFRRGRQRPAGADRRARIRPLRPRRGQEGARQAELERHAPGPAVQGREPDGRRSTRSWACSHAQLLHVLDGEHLPPLKKPRDDRPGPEQLPSWRRRLHFFKKRGAQGLRAPLARRPRDLARMADA